MIEPTPTKRFVADILRSCPLKCRMCYHLHTYNSWNEQTWSFEQIKQCIDEGKERGGNNYMDITGGEPTIHPNICATIEYALSKDIRTCIITSGYIHDNRINSIISSGIDDWLVSRHGLKDTHNFVTNNQEAYDRQIKFLDRIKNKGMSFRFNCVINKFNQTDLYKIAQEMIKFKPRIVNFINMNPHKEWMDKTLETQEVIADLELAGFYLDMAIELLESKGIGVNVRYYPMCQIDEKYRRCVCNDSHVMFDPYEWDYQTTPKTLDRFKQWGIDTSNCVELKEEPCKSCDLFNICGGINKAFHNACGDNTQVEKITNFTGDKNDFYWYRKHNINTLQER
jgi:MoaA/NifB/PqqE/SkfB family radical SAM enzyme